MLAEVLQKKRNNLILSKIYGASYFSLKKEIYEKRFDRAFEIVKKLGLKNYFLFYLKERYNITTYLLNNTNPLNKKFINLLTKEELETLFSFFDKLLEVE